MEIHVGKCSSPLKERTLQEEVLPAHRFQDMSATGSISPQPDLGIDVSARIDCSPSGILPSRKGPVLAASYTPGGPSCQGAFVLLFLCTGWSQEALTSDGHTEPMGGNHAVAQPALLGIARVIHRTYS